MFKLPHIFLPPEAKVLILTKKFFDKNYPKESIDDTCKEIIKKFVVNFALPHYTFQGMISIRCYYVSIAQLFASLNKLIQKSVTRRRYYSIARAP